MMRSLKIALRSMRAGARLTKCLRCCGASGDSRACGRCRLEAIQAGLDRRDSLVVMPTGGGKSLCYQVPPAVAGRTDVVVSPLIALMKDQVDALRLSGYPAAAIHSGMDQMEVRDAEREIAAGRHHLIFVAPERLLTPRFLELAARLKVTSFAIDEAHCISQWGHDFRPEYRRLAELKTRFPGASIHAYTATATARVRTDIVEQLGLDDPAVLVGSFDRPNLLYRVRAETGCEYADRGRRFGGIRARRRSFTASAGKTPSTSPRTWRRKACARLPITREWKRTSGGARRIASPPRKSTWWWRQLRSAWESIAATSDA